MTEDEREEMVNRLEDDFRQSIGSAFNNEVKYAFRAGARAALVEVADRLRSSALPNGDGA